VVDAQLMLREFEARHLDFDDFYYSSITSIKDWKKRRKSIRSSL
jgi:hypothetical protein